MDFGALPPEVNSARMYAGPGAGPMLAAAVAWDHLAADLHSTAASYQSVVTGLTAGAWQGPASASMAAAAAPYVTWISATAAQCEQVANQARAAVSAYEAAFAMTVPPPLIAANRAQLMALVATNFLGQNTPAIMATEAHYGEMWAQDAAAMYGYAGSSAQATTLAPFIPPQQTTNPGGLAGQAAAVAHATGTSAATHTQTTALSLSTVPQALQTMASPASPSGLSQMVMGSGTSAATSAASAPASALTGLTGASGKGAGNSAGAAASTSSGLGGLSGLLGGGTNGPGGMAGLGADAAGLGADGAGLGTDVGGLGAVFFGVGFDLLGADELTESGGLGPLASGLGDLGPLGGLGSAAGLGPLGGLGSAGGLGPLGGLGSAGASASVGQAASIGALSAPQGWADVAPAGSISSASAMPLPGSSFGTAHAVSAGGSSVSKISLPTLAGGQANGAVDKLGFRPTVVPRSPLAG